MSLRLAGSFVRSQPSPNKSVVPDRLILRADEASLNPQEQQASADWVEHAAPITSYIADLERRACEGRTIATSSHHPQDNLGTLRTSGFCRPAESTQEGRPDGAAGEISQEIESAKRCPNCVETVLGVRGCPKSTQPKSSKFVRPDT